MSDRGGRFTEEEIIVISFLAKYNCKKLGFNSNQDIYRTLESNFSRKASSSKAKYENIKNHTNLDFSLNAGSIKINPCYFCFRNNSITEAGIILCNSDILTIESAKSVPVTISDLQTSITL